MIGCVYKVIFQIRLKTSKELIMTLWDWVQVRYFCKRWLCQYWPEQIRIDRFVNGSSTAVQKPAINLVTSFMNDDKLYQLATSCPPHFTCPIANWRQNRRLYSGMVLKVEELHVISDGMSIKSHLMILLTTGWPKMQSITTRKKQVREYP